MNREEMAEAFERRGVRIDETLAVARTIAHVLSVTTLSPLEELAALAVVKGSCIGALELAADQMWGQDMLTKYRELESEMAVRHDYAVGEVAAERAAVEGVKS